MNHQHIIISAHNLAKPPRTRVEMVAWLSEMVDAIGMKTLMGPYATRCETAGNEGVTGVVVIETSHISCHCWDSVEEPFLKADVYSCKEFDTKTVLEMFQRFRPSHIEYLGIDRNDRMVVSDVHGLFYHNKPAIVDCAMPARIGLAP
jgi:S-adenosylmethionine/arginine decarboxylase-like enzyme